MLQETIRPFSRANSTGTTPTPVSSLILCMAAGSPSTNAAPRTGCPANGNSTDGVKMRTRASPPSCAGNTKTVSDRLNSLAIRCIRSAGMPCASVTTAAGFPSNGVSVKTSTTMYRYIANKLYIYVANVKRASRHATRPTHPGVAAAPRLELGIRRRSGREPRRPATWLPYLGAGVSGQAAAVISPRVEWPAPAPPDCHAAGQCDQAASACCHQPRCCQGTRMGGCATQAGFDAAHRHLHGAGRVEQVIDLQMARAVKDDDRVNAVGDQLDGLRGVLALTRSTEGPRARVGHPVAAQLSEGQLARQHFLARGDR